MPEKNLKSDCSKERLKMLQRGKSGILKKTTYAGDVKERQESNSDDVEPDWDPASNLILDNSQ